MPEFTASVKLDNVGVLDIHCVYSCASADQETTPILFLHGWPGPLVEVQKILPLLNKGGFDVIAPSLHGYDFSSYPTKAGFKHRYHAEELRKLILRLGYEQYAIQGGDWGSDIARAIAVMFHTYVKALPQNMLIMAKPDCSHGGPQCSDFEKTCMKRFD